MAKKYLFLFIGISLIIITGLFSFGCNTSLSDLLGGSTSSSGGTSSSVTLTDTESVASAKSDLTYSNITFAGVETSSDIKNNFTLPLTGTNGTTISWAADITNDCIISGGSATVRRSATDKTITLTATITKGSISDTKTFTIIIKAMYAGSITGRVDLGAWDPGNYVENGKLYNGYYYFQSDNASAQNSIFVVNCTDKSNPVFVKEVAIPTRTFQIEIYNNKLYHPRGSKKIGVFDISNPASMSDNTPDTIIDCSAICSGSTFYSITIDSSGSYLYAITNNSPQEVIKIAVSDYTAQKITYTGTFKGYWRVLYNNNYLYGLGYDSSLYYIDLSSDSASSIALAGSSACYIGKFSNNFLLVGTWTTFDIIDVTNPATPIKRSSHSVGGYSEGAVFIGNIAYLNTSNGYTYTLDMSSPATLPNNSKQTFLTISGSSSGGYFAGEGNYACMFDQATAEVIVIRLSD